MSHSSTKVNNPRIFEEAREAIIKLETLSRVLTPAELETLEILFDKHATAIITTSLQEAQRGKIESITKIL
jgi:DNA replication protein DnaD